MLSDNSHAFEYIIFDLSEVLIRGLVGIETVLAQELALSKEAVLSAFAGPWQQALFEGHLSETTYLQKVIETQDWNIKVSSLQAVIRDNFRHEIVGMRPVLAGLRDQKYRLVLLSDHAQEWIQYIATVHPFLSTFPHAFYSFDMGSVKANPRTFLMVASALSTEPHRCLFIDDNPHNVQQAQAAGMRGIRFSTVPQLLTDLSTHGIYLELE